METLLFSTLLADESTSWLGWLLLIPIIITFGVVVLTKYLITIAKNVRTLRAEMRQPSDYKKQVKKENDISDVLISIKHDLGADRVSILQYHNGIYSIAHNSLLKLSATHESISPGVVSNMKEFQNIPSSFFGPWNTKIFEGRYVALPEIPESRDCAMVQLLEGRVVKSLYLFPIEDPYGQTFGIGIVEYTSSHKDLSDKWLYWAKRRFSGVGALLAGTKD